jgi:uncharacterized membrane protein YeaQ/YmgE (transglycosylase-associated protein family)
LFFAEWLKNEMDIPQLLIKLLIAILCAALADVLVPRRIPGGIAGLILIGLAGIWLGEWGFALLRQEFGLNFAVFYWRIQGVLIIPAIIGCAIILYVVTAFINWARYGN